jgi:hypothetical protein
MTRSQDFDAMSAHYGYGPVGAVLSQRFGATFEFTTTGETALRWSPPWKVDTKS